jgi:hypothetical protein
MNAGGILQGLLVVALRAIDLCRPGSWSTIFHLFHMKISPFDLPVAAVTGVRAMGRSRVSLGFDLARMALKARSVVDELIVVGIGLALNEKLFLLPVVKRRDFLRLGILFALPDNQDGHPDHKSDPEGKANKASVAYPSHAGGKKSLELGAGISRANFRIDHLPSRMPRIISLNWLAETTVNVKSEITVLPFALK